MTAYDESTRLSEVRKERKAKEKKAKEERLIGVSFLDFLEPSPLLKREEPKP